MAKISQAFKSSRNFHANSFESLQIVVKSLESMSHVSGAHWDVARVVALAGEIKHTVWSRFPKFINVAVMP